MSLSLIVADHLSGTLNASTAGAVTCAKDIQAEAVDVLVLAADGAALAGEAAHIDGVSRVLHAYHEANAHPVASTMAPQIAAAAKAGGYSHVLGPNTTFGKDLMPCVAALLDVAMVTDIMAVHGPQEFDRPIYAGNAVVTLKAPAD
jgi:electron transfer flavoprotein alpha subunit